MQEWQKRQAEEHERTIAIVRRRSHSYVPLLWLPYGAKSPGGGPRLAGRFWGAFGMFAIGAWGLTHAYRSTLRFYLGGKTKKAAPTPSAARTVRSRPRESWSNGGCRLVPEEAPALAMASLRSMLRGAGSEDGFGDQCPDLRVPRREHVFQQDRATCPTGQAVCGQRRGRPWRSWGLTQLMFNHFGFDRSGFRAIVLLPTPRRHILLGKNLALLPVALAVFAIYLGLAAVLAHLRVWDILAAVIEFSAAFLVISVLGNLASIFVPYRIAAGSLRANQDRLYDQSADLRDSYCFFHWRCCRSFCRPGWGCSASISSCCLPAAVTLLVRGSVGRACRLALLANAGAAGKTVAAARASGFSKS